ncbi:unnamed protein product [Urochloa decumbens]|uniref:DUF295 domain-containing protein n=1 Tax=Urochloa decumbens TaxID=240449 RepID=A0ABC9AL27_9POAL
MDSGAGSSADHTQHAPLPVCVRKGGKASRSLAAAVATAAGQARCSTKCARAPETGPDEAQEPQHRPWADLPADILGVVVGRLPLVEDRARLRSVCRAWSAAAHLHRRPPPPLPLLVLSDFSFASFCAGGTLTGARRRIPLPERETASAGSVRCVGSCEGWLVGVKLNKGRYFGDLRCFLMKAFSRDVIRLPPPSAAARPVDAYSLSLPIVNGSGVMNCAINATQCVMSFYKVVLSDSPDSGSKCVAVGISDVKGAVKLAFWRPGMKSWCVCNGACITEFIDIVFCHGKLYVLSSSEFTTDLFAFEISEDKNGMIVSRVERVVFELPEATGNYNEMWRIVEWRGKLLIVASYSGDTEFGHVIVEVRVFESDFTTNPVRFTEIVSLDGDCIFISPSSSKSFCSCDYDGVGEDLIYFIDGNLCPEKFVYNMKDGMMAPLVADGPEDKFWTPDDGPKIATWLFPTE